jgi:hypothetical protein
MSGKKTIPTIDTAADEFWVTNIEKNGKLFVMKTMERCVRLKNCNPVLFDINANI